MKIEHLREFLILEKTRNFSEAAKILHISQSSLSKHIAALEDEVDVDLFKRLGNTLQLTEAGSVFLDGADAERVLKKMEESTGVSPGSFDPDAGAVVSVSVKH